MATEQAETDIREYVGQRAELLARLVLTRRKRTFLYELGKKNDFGFDLFVTIRQPIGPQKIVPSFAVQIMGTSKSLPTERDATAAVRGKSRRWDAKRLFLFPVMLMMFSMEGDEGYFSWLVEPVVDSNGPKLVPADAVEMKKITTKGMDHAYQQVDAWFDAMAEIVTREHKPVK